MNEQEKQALIERDKLEHMLAYARQQKEAGAVACRVPPSDMVEIMERLLASLSGGPAQDMLNKLAVILHGSVTDIGLLPVTAQSLLARVNSSVIPDGWIKCSERMPEVGDKVLVRIPVCNYFNIENAEYKGDGRFLCAWFSTRGKGCTYDVTHWQPLPPAPAD